MALLFAVRGDKNLSFGNDFLRFTRNCFDFCWSRVLVLILVRSYGAKLVNLCY